VISGEGKLDEQNLHGKVPADVAKGVLCAGVPCVALCGSLGEETFREKGAEFFSCGITAMFSNIRQPGSLAEALSQSRENYAALADNFFRVLSIL
jgi:glycerate kinase